MTRNWGIPSGEGGFRNARRARPVLTLAVTAVFGVIGASVAALGFSGARLMLSDLFHGPSLFAAVIAAGFGCWVYIFLAWQRFAAQFSGGDAFSDLLQFYARAAIGLFVLHFLARFAELVFGQTISGLLLCTAAGAGAAAAFQTVMMFVPPGRIDNDHS